MDDHALSGLFDPETTGVQCRFIGRLYKIVFPTIIYPPGWETKTNLIYYIYGTKEQKFRFMGQFFDTLEEIKTHIKKHEANVFTEQDIQYARITREQAIKDVQKIGQKMPAIQTTCKQAIKNGQMIGPKMSANHNGVHDLIQCYRINHLDIEFLPEPPMELVGKRRNGCLNRIVTFGIRQIMPHAIHMDALYRCHPAKFRQGLKKALKDTQ